MAQLPYADPIVGILTVPSSLIIYNDGFYSLDGGITRSADTIGPETQIIAAAGASISIALQNTLPVRAKWISVPGGSLDLAGPGALHTDNQDVALYARTCGIRVTGNITIHSGATVRAIGLTDGLTAINSSSILTVSENSNLYGEFTGFNPAITGAGKYGVYCGGSIVAASGGQIEGVGALQSYGAYGVFCDASHRTDTAMSIASGCQVRGTASVGVYLGGPTIVNGILTGTGGSLRVAHGIQGDRAGITINSGAAVTATAEAGAYAGIIMVYGYQVNGGTLTADGGSFAVRGAGSGLGNMVVTGGGSVVGTSSDVTDGNGVYVLNGNLTVENGLVRGTGVVNGVYVNGDLTADQGVVDGYTYAYGQNADGYFGAVIAQGTLSASDRSQIIENYSRIEYFDEAYRLPYYDGKNMTDYRDYAWSVSTGTGSVSADPEGRGLHATSDGRGTLTAVRGDAVAGEVVELASGSSHTIHIPVELSTSPVYDFYVTYDGNGATSGTAPVDFRNPYVENAEVTVLDNSGGLTLPGYQFSGWSETPDGSGTVYQPNDLFRMPPRNVTLYAVWRELPTPGHNVIYDGNGAAAGQVPVDPYNPYESDAVVTVLDNTGNLANPGYRFAGWSLSPDGSVVYRPGDSFRMPSGDVTLYAVWLPELPPPFRPVPPCCLPCRPISCCRPPRTPLSCRGC